MVDVTSLKTPASVEKKRRRRSRRGRKGAKVASKRMALQVQLCSIDVEGPCMRKVVVDMRVSCYFSSIAFAGEATSAVKTERREANPLNSKGKPWTQVVRPFQIVGVDAEREVRKLDETF